MNILALSGFENFIRLITLLVVFGLVLGITYFVTRWVGGYQREKLAKGNVQIIEAKQINNNKFIYVAKIGNDYFALSSGKENFTVIGKLDPDGITLPEPTQPIEIKEPFAKFLEKVKKNKHKDDEL